MNRSRSLGKPPITSKITAIDIDQEAYEIGLPYIKEAGVEQKINFINGDALPEIVNMVQEGSEVGSFDFIFVDVPTVNYREYHDHLTKLVRVGGLIAYDNTLWFGSVAEPMVLEMIFSRDNPRLATYEGVREFMAAFNDFLVNDQRFDVSMHVSCSYYDRSVVKSIPARKR